jgi:PAS domain S-box-containing protein
LSTARIADNLPVGLVVLNDLFVCNYLNEEASDVVGYSLVESKATAFPMLVLNDNNAQQLMDALAALDGEHPYDNVYALQSKNGERYVSLTASCVKDENSKAQYLIVLHDITELHREVQHWKETAHAARDTQQAEEQYLARMSHEIRTAMNGIIGLTNVLMQNGLPGEQQQILNLIKQSTDNLLVIINDILDLSKIRSGKLQIEKIPVNVRDLFESLYAITLPKIGQKEIQFSYRLGNNVPEHVETDPVRLNQILLNLLSNSIKFTEKGKIRYSVELVERLGEKVKLQFEVRDTGIGIEPEALDSIFETYRQATSSTTRYYGGTGLGLPIVKQLVEAMGGKIDVKSKAGRGTAFTFALTFDVAAKPEMQEAAIAAPSVPEGLRVLVVDDNYINRLLVIHLLQSRGFDVVEANSGYEALDKLRDEDIDAVLMDISMPDLDGFETTKLIRRSDQAYIRDVPVIAMTAHGFQEQINNAREAGMNDYVVKPFKPDQLVKTILQQLGGIEESKPLPSRLYDLSFLEDYYNNDKTFIRHILELYVKETPRTLDELQESYDKKDWKQFKALVHKIKTNVLMLGIKGEDEFFAASSELDVNQADNSKVGISYEQFKKKVSKALTQLRSDELS